MEVRCALYEIEISLMKMLNKWRYIIDPNGTPRSILHRFFQIIELFLTSRFVSNKSSDGELLCNF